VLRTGKEYEARLRQQHSKLHPRTSWAAAEGRKRRRQRGRDAAEPDDDEDEEG
jgi:U3 small nucleolar RNA-associated protein 18